MKQAIALLCLVACGGGGSSLEPNPPANPPPAEPPPPPPAPPPPPPAPGVVASVTITAGGNQKAEVGNELPEAVVVRATDAQAVAVQNQLINFVVVSGGGSVFAGTAQTNGAGEARERWTLGTAAGEQVLEARAVDQNTGDPIVFERVTATAEPGPAASLTFADTVNYVGGPNGPREIAEVRMFLGEERDLAALIAGAADQYGNSITGPALELAARAPFAVAGTSLSSLAEVKDQVTLTSGSATAQVEVTAIRHLSDLVGGRGSYSCTGLNTRPGGPGDTDPRGVITKQQSDFVVDSAVYAGSGSAAAALWITNSLVLTFEDGSVESQEPFVEALQVGLQEPGFIYLGVHIDRANVVSASPLTYVGGANCPSWYQLASSEPFTITKD